MRIINTLIASACMLFFVNVKAQVSDKNGKSYKTIKIGNQEWLAENLDASLYRNGDIIPEVQDPKKWANLSTGAWCYYENKTENGTKYGKLYNWYAVNDPRGLAPEGWHVPSDNEWTQLVDFLGGEAIAGAAMKSSTGWRTEGKDTNSIGFSALPGGSHDFDGAFYGIGANWEWWSATESNTYNAWFRFLNNFFNNASRGNYDKLSGFSVRCVKD